MRIVVLLIAVTCVTLAAMGGSGTTASQENAPRHWYKGNTHTHTLNSDGDSTPDDVAKWYREHGYRFLVLSDHNVLTNPDGLNAVLGASEQFLLIKGEEVTDRFGDKPIHVNALEPSQAIDPQHGSSVLDVMQRTVDAIRKGGGVPHINHPNFGWAITAADLQAVQNDKLFEIYNGHHQVNNLGGGGVPGMEEVWDRMLSSGKVIYGLADDDAHVFKQPGNPNVPGPGRGWVFVRAERLAPRPIVEALERGDFYASTGVELTDYQVTGRRVTITIKTDPSSKYRVQFIGRNGVMLGEATTSPAVYDFKGDELYVRAKVIESNGKLAWTQPVWKR